MMNTLFPLKVSDNSAQSYPHYHQLALAIYGGVLLMGTINWLLRPAPASPFSFGLSSQVVTFFIPMIALIALEVWAHRVDPHMQRFALARLSCNIALSSLVILSGGYFYGQFLFLIAILFAELAFPRWVSFCTIGVTSFVLFLRLAYGPRGDFLSAGDVQTLLSFAVAVLLMMLLGALIKREWEYRLDLQSLNDELSDSHEQLKQSTELLAELAVVNERNRMARDIHDSLGHHLAAVSIQLDMAGRLFERNPAQSVIAIGEAQNATKEALREVRQSVDALRSADKPFELIPAIELLIDRMSTDTLSISYRVEGDVQDWPLPLLMTFYRACQEGLTNIYKYASASHANLWLQFMDNEARLRIVDDGMGFDLEQKRSGTGLQGLRERVDDLGGAVTIDSRPNEGTILDICIPKTKL